MKREFLKSIEGLTDEAIDKIMAEAGKDIAKEQAKAEQSAEQTKAQIEKLQSENKSKDEMISNYKAETEKFKEMDIESIQKKVTELETANQNYQNQIKESKTAYEKQIADMNYSTAIKDTLSNEKFTSNLVKKAFADELKNQGFKLDESGSLLGAKEFIEKYKTENQGVFAPVETTQTQQVQQPGIQQFAAATSGGQVPQKGMSLLDAMKAGNAGQNVDFSQVGRFATQQQQ
ncbi:phage minor structural protein GP20 [Clostridium saccharobutylicum]|uniref:phage scaffolding protein n=1 Tax=Clostridium saccharobutylicum TaxID=169679 RepID=UPI00098CBDEA|nr:phage scaffolding protein [Clostridium saccharobutylicum]OOM17215.1 phage minor structural protein GP20 [Clostridium saccharobutylicum]